MGSVAFTMTPRSKLVWLRARGEVLLEQLMRQATQVYQDPDLRCDVDTFMGLGEAVREFQPSRVQPQRAFFEALGSRAGERRWAIHARQHGTLRSANMARSAMEQLTGRVRRALLEFKVFHERRQALAWPGKPDPAVDAGLPERGANSGR